MTPSAAQTPLFQISPLPKAERGAIYALGRHRLMCGDATDKGAVARLCDGRKPTLVVTSPPYADARDYNDAIPCWDSMMLGALDGHRFSDDAQLLINLGVIHRKGEWVPYWWNWVQAMRGEGWQHAGMYVWDKLTAIPGAPTGSPRPAHEFLFHLRKQRAAMRLTEECISVGRKGRLSLRDANGVTRRKKHNNTSVVGSHKVLDSVLRMSPEKNNKTAHPAVFPVALPAKLVAAWKNKESVVYDPFSGAATTLLACEAEGVDGLAMEISPAYCDLSMARWRKMHPDQAIERVD